MFELLIRVRIELLPWIERAAFAAPLLARITLGTVFIASGWGKLHDLPGVSEFFESLGLPLASLQAPFIATRSWSAGCCDDPRPASAPAPGR